MSDRADELLRAVIALEDHRPPKGIGFPMWNERRRKLLTEVRAYLSENQPINDAGGVSNRADDPKREAVAEPQGAIRDTVQYGNSREGLRPSVSDDGDGTRVTSASPHQPKWPHTMDAKVWAEEFCARFSITQKENPDGSVSGEDVGTMIGWFSNAIMAGYDTAQSRATPIQQTAQPVAWTDARLDELVAELRDYQEWARKNRKRNSCWQDLDFAADAIQTLRTRVVAETSLYAAAQPIPREPTDEMNAAARRRVGFACPDLWRAMWDAAAKSTEP